MLSENVMWGREGTQTEINILRILIDVFVCVLPSLNRYTFQGYSHMDCNEAVLCGPLLQDHCMISASREILSQAPQASHCLNRR